MRVTATQAAVDIIERAKESRAGVLTITIGTGCCESTAPFLYEDYYSGPDAEQVGEVAGVPVMGDAFIRDLYPGEEGVTIDAVEEPVESLSVETEFGCRLVLRGSDASGCDIPAHRPAVGSASPSRTGGVRGEMPEALRGWRIR
ncbi:MAG: hypothetical protein JJLCMIEE_01463 [Acidimicrobiales bacterium]|nr:MAG: DUF779 domain-containing protein [Actinomycetota bacterium]MBV6508402.1 hypothetical protein [Acidimicrobiales bacterium]RIK04787.1 MAG: hypothetical protein DCC48_12110 [Acidobacteriota bacterium]